MEDIVGSCIVLKNGKVKMCKPCKSKKGSGIKEVAKKLKPLARPLLQLGTEVLINKYGTPKGVSKEMVKSLVDETAKVAGLGMCGGLMASKYGGSFLPVGGSFRPAGGSFLPAQGH